MLGAMVWALENPERGMVEPDDIDYRRVLDIADPYLGDVVGKYSDWTPLKDRGWLFKEERGQVGPVAVQEFSRRLTRKFKWNRR